MVKDANTTGDSNVPAPLPTETSDPERTIEPPHDQSIGETEGPVPKRIGRYHIRRLIAAGGMGAVYEATQDNPRRVVAVKVMKQGIASRSALRRFEYESQLLARLRHSGIAQIYEAGSHQTSTGMVPYFAMEYIPNAKPITQFANEKQWGTRQRLELFARVCDAVHHGHQKGIIHRDLKPSNILVDSSAQPKVIDFGVARSTDSDMAVTTLQTDVGQLIGTLQYMSPEQCDADPHDIDTRSDVYALGVVLYELLCGKPPYDLTRIAMHQATRIIREHHPARLSTLNRTLRGDVETIALKALEKERERRYQSADEFGRDIQRYLVGEAIVARRASILYQLRIFARRNRVVFASLAATFAVITTAAIVSTSLYLGAERARREARHAQADAERSFAAADAARAAETQQREKAESNEKESELRAKEMQSTLHFLREMLASAKPQIAKGRELTVREILDEASKTVHEKLRDQPLVEAQVRWTIAHTYLDLGRGADAIPHYEFVRDAWTSAYGPVSAKAIDATAALAAAHYHSGDGKSAVEINQLALERAREHYGEEDVRTAAIMVRVANYMRDQGDFGAAEPLAAKGLEVLTERGGSAIEIAVAQGCLGWLYKDQGRFKDAERLYRASLEIRRGQEGDANPWTIQHLSELALICLRQGKASEAEPFAAEAASLARKYLDASDEKTQTAIFRYSWALERLGRYQEAERERRDLMRIQSGLQGRESIAVCESLHELTRMAALGGDPQAAKQYAQELSDLGRAALRRPDVEPMLLNDCAMQLLELDPPEFRDVETALLMARRAVGSSAGENPLWLDTLSLALERSGDLAGAVQAQERAVLAASPSDVPLGAYVGMSERWLRLLRKSGDKEAEDAGVRRLLALAGQIDAATLEDNAVLLNALAVMIANARRPADALPFYQKILDIRRRQHGDSHPSVALQLNNIGACLLELGKLDEAEPTLRRSLEIHLTNGGDATFSVGNTRSHLGECLKRKGALEDAEKEQLEAYRVLLGVAGASDAKTVRSARRLADLYDAMGKPEEAARWRARLGGAPE